MIVSVAHRSRTGSFLQLKIEKIVYGYLVKVPKLENGNVFNCGMYITCLIDWYDFAGNDSDCYHSTDSDSLGSSDTDDESIMIDHVLIGRVLATGEYKYTGVLEVPKVPHHIKEQVAQLPIDNPRLQGLEPKLYVYVDNGD
jgi:hypothetical protein